METCYNSRPGAARIVRWIVVLQFTLCSLPLANSAPRHREAPGPEVAPGVFALGTIQNPEIKENSGLVASRRHHGVFWTHNDSGHAAVLFAITRAGESVAQFPVTGATLEDWEDIDLDNAGNLYLADIGNNNHDRNEVAVHRVREPNLRRTSTGDVTVNKTWKLKFPDKSFNSESFVVSGGYGYLISKDLEEEGAPIYRFPLLVRSSDSITLEKFGTLPIEAEPAGADLSGNRRRLAIITSAGAYLVMARGNGNALTSERYTLFFVPFAHALMEGVAFDGDGIVVSSETGELFLFNDTPFRTK